METESFIYKNRDFYTEEVNPKFTKNNVVYSKKGAICTLVSLNHGQTVYLNAKSYYVSYFYHGNKYAVLSDYKNNEKITIHYNEELNQWDWRGNYL